jgi:hypothetical protein
VTITLATNLDCIEAQVEEFERFSLRKRPNPEKSSFRITFLNPSNIEDTASRIEVNQHQER